MLSHEVGAIQTKTVMNSHQSSDRFPILVSSHILFYGSRGYSLLNSSCQKQGVEMQSTPPSTHPENEVSLLSPGTGSIQDVHLGQVVFGSHSCRVLLY